MHMKDCNYWLDRGKELYDSGRISEAILAYESCLSLKQGNIIEANEGLVACYLSASINKKEMLGKAIDCLRVSVDLGDMESCHELGNIYCNKDSEYHDARAGIKWHLKALDMGHVGSTMKIVKMYLTSKYDDEGLTIKDREALNIGLDETKAREILNELPGHMSGFVDDYIKEITGKK